MAKTKTNFDNFVEEGQFFFIYIHDNLQKQHLYQIDCLIFGVYRHFQHIYQNPGIYNTSETKYRIKGYKIYS